MKSNLNMINLAINFQRIKQYYFNIEKVTDLKFKILSDMCYKIEFYPSQIWCLNIHYCTDIVKGIIAFKVKEIRVVAVHCYSGICIL